MCSRGDFDWSFGCQGIQHLPLPLSSTHAEQLQYQLATHSVKDDDEKGRFTILQEDPTLYPHTCLLPMIHMGTVMTEWATQCFPRVNMCSTIEIVKQVVNLQQMQLPPVIHWSTLLKQH
jgi:hypothetical protein